MKNFNPTQQSVEGDGCRPAGQFILPLLKRWMQFEKQRDGFCFTFNLLAGILRKKPKSLMEIPGLVAEIK